jgi:HK97 family phage portal protein
MSRKSFLKNIMPDFTKAKVKLHKKSAYSPDIFGGGNFSQTYIFETNRAVWSARNYNKFSEEAYIKNVIAYRSISMLACSVGTINWCLHKTENSEQIEVRNHPLLKLLAKPNPLMSGALFFETLASHKLIGGNCFILAVSSTSGEVKELYALRPDRVNIITDEKGIITAYQYKVGQNIVTYPVDKLTGKSKILHIKNFHPLNDHYGLSPVEAAAFSIDQHNNSSMWNQALLQNGAKPSGALIVKGNKDGNNHLNDEQFLRLKKQVEEQYSGAVNAGRPLLLEGGLEWKEMSMSPKDMDFIEAKHSSARDIALAFGVPPHLLGIPGDNTYANLAEARLAMWEQTILPLVDNILGSLNNWLVPMFKSSTNLKISYELDKISALAVKREKTWYNLQNADFLTVNEKRKMVGLGPIENAS